MDPEDPKSTLLKVLATEKFRSLAVPLLAGLGVL
jgi:hypothetical protein